MQKKLFTQIRNEWRGNLWLALELLVVSVVMWYIIDLLYCRLATFNEPRGFDTEHCYLVAATSISTWMAWAMRNSPWTATMWMPPCTAWAASPCAAMPARPT